jgi:flagellar biosynthetic protein FlhB
VEESKEQRTEQPTHRKKQKAREKGQVARSTELTAAFVVIGGIAVLHLLFPWLVTETGEFASKAFSGTTVIASGADVQTITLDVILGAAKIVSPVLLAVFGIALVANYTQVGFLFSTTPIALNLAKINPIAGFKRIFSMRSLVRVLINCAKAGLLGAVFYLSIKSGMDSYFSLSDCSIAEIVHFMGKEAFSIAVKAGLILVLLGLLDYAFQRREHIKSLMMTKHELKEEYKEIEGSPLIKSRIKTARLKLARQRMMKAVPTADVVVTNPVHLAVAIKYDIETMVAPKVVAKGKRLVAEKIKEIATGHGIPIFENKDLAQSLYDLVDVGSEIPENLYRAVAEVLSYIYRLKGRVPALMSKGIE